MIFDPPHSDRRHISNFELAGLASLRSLQRISSFRRAARGGVILKTLVILALTAIVFGGGAYFTYRLFIEPTQILKNESAFGSPTPPPDMTIPEYERCLQLKNDHQWQDARAAYEHFLETYPRRLRVGDTLYVSHPDFTLVIDRKTQIVTLYNHARFFKQYHPTGWTAPPLKGNPPPVAGKVLEVASFRNGQRVAFGSRDFDQSSHRVQIAPPGYTLYTDPAQGGEKAGAGIALSASDMDELSALLTKGVQVTIR